MSLQKCSVIDRTFARKFKLIRDFLFKFQKNWLRFLLKYTLATEVNG
jgi:hypothetical protein